MPNLPSISGGWSLKGMLSQLPLGLEMTPVNLSSSLSQEMHLSCFLVSRASFSFSSSSEMTRMISLILDSRKSRAFLTSSLSLLRQIWSQICVTFSSICSRYLSQSFWPTLVSSFDFTSFRLVKTSVCRVLSFSSSLETLFSLMTLARSLMLRILSSRRLSLKDMRSSRVSSLAQSLTISGFISLILSLMPSVLFSLLSSVRFCDPERFSTFRFYCISLSWISKCFIFSDHFQSMLSKLLSIMLSAAVALRCCVCRFCSQIEMLGLLEVSSRSVLGSLRLQKLLGLGLLVGACVVLWLGVWTLLRLPIWLETLPMGELVMLTLSSFLTRSSISLSISTSFLACRRSAFSLSISIFSILWCATLSSFSKWQFLSLSISVSLKMRSASTLFSFLLISSPSRACSAARLWMLRSNSYTSFCFTSSFYSNCS